jgi:hypothetical protein
MAFAMDMFVSHVCLSMVFRYIELLDISKPHRSVRQIEFPPAAASAAGAVKRRADSCRRLKKC